MDITPFQDSLAQFPDGLAQYLGGISQNAAVGAVTAWGERRDAERTNSHRLSEIERERLKSLIQRIEQKLLEALAALPGDQETARLLVREVGDPIFLRLLATQVSLGRFEPEPFLEGWLVERPDIQAHRETLLRFVRPFFDAVASAIASDTEIRGRIQMQMLGRLNSWTERVEAALLPPTAPVTQPPAIPPLEELHRACAIASQALLSWPTSIDGERMESPAFAQLVEPRPSEQSNVQLLLGEPGSGKSALLAQLGRWFLERGCLVLAIKADLLPQSVDSVAKLGLHLGLGELPGLALRSLARTAPVIVLVDQLDALADLVDLHGGRLNAVLQLVRELWGAENLRVIASSRDVEHRHDARLAAIAAEPVQLPLLTWDQVQEFLQRKHGIAAKDWPETFREILRRPQQLAVFIKLLSSGEEMPIFTSYQLMLERLWAQCVTNADGLAGRAELLRNLARQMAAEESLWLARARFDDRAPQVEQLLAAGILTTAEDERRLGYQHQTVFDFSLARSFAGGGLTDFVVARQQSLFVRPRLWSGLVYLRGAEPHTYRREFAALWQRQDLRYHVRLQLVEFLGQLEDPDQSEEGFLRAALADPALRVTALVAIVGRRTWFELLSPDVLPRLMAEGNALGRTVFEVLSIAAKHNSHTVLTLLREQWIKRPDVDWWTGSVLTHIQPWNSEATALAEILANRSKANASRLFDVISFAAETDAILAVPILAAFLKQEVAEVESLSAAIETDGDENPFAQMFRDSPRHHAANNVLQGNTDWPDLKPIAEAAPAVFIDSIWPLFIRLLAVMDDKDGAAGDAFHSEYGLGLSARDGSAPLLEAIEIAAESLAQSNGAGFSDFLRKAAEINSMTVQRVLARSLAGVAAQEPLLALVFLLGDPRRLRLGGYNDEHRDTGTLISSVCPHISHEQMRSLEQAIGAWECLRTPRPDIEPEKIQRWTREDRLRLWRYIPEQFRAPEVAAAIVAGDSEFPGLIESEDDDSPHIRVGVIGSPMSTDAMEKASDAEVLATLAELPDRTEWEHPKDGWKGGSIQVSRAFSELAKKQPERAIALIGQLDPAEHTRPAAYALEKLAESEVPSEKLFAFVRKLNARGFRSVEFRVCAADSVRKRLKKDEPLPDDLFAMFEQWLPELAEETARDESEENIREDDHKTTLLWQSQYSWTVPHGSCAVLTALEAACRVARQPDRFLAIVQGHLERPERVTTWRALCWHLDLLGFADRPASAAFLSALFRRFPKVRDSVAGLRATAEALRWLAPETVREIIEGVRASDWPSSGRAFGELVMYRHVFWEDEWAAATIAKLLADPTTAQEVLTGLATTAAHAFAELGSRSKAAIVLKTVLPRADEATALAVLDLFSLLPQLDSDPELLGLLKTLLANPNALVAHDLGSLVERLPDLIPAHSALAANLANAILDRHAEALLDMRTSFSASASGLINLALTLHRDEGVGRERGLALFERLLALNVAGTRNSLLAVDGRPVAVAEFHFRRRTQRVQRLRKR